MTTDEQLQSLTSERDRLREEVDGLSKVQCPCCGAGVFITAQTPASDHPELTEHVIACKSCDWQHNAPVDQTKLLATLRGLLERANVVADLVGKGSEIRPEAMDSAQQLASEIESALEK